MLLNNPRNRAGFTPIALTMVGTLALTREKMDMCMSMFPEPAKVVRQWTIRLAVRRGLGRELKKFKTGKKVMAMMSQYRSSAPEPGAMLLTEVQQIYNVVEELMEKSQSQAAANQ